MRHELVTVPGAGTDIDGGAITFVMRWTDAVERPTANAMLRNAMATSNVIVTRSRAPDSIAVVGVSIEVEVEVIVCSLCAPATPVWR
jgi:hypothetical protein